MSDIKLKNVIVNVDIDKIVPHNGSHKTDSSLNMLVESIKEFGVTQPISVDRNYVVVTGNGVYKAAKILGLKTLPCIILDDLSDEEIAQYRIADDKTQEFATWNEKKLRKELSYLQDPSSMQPYFDQDILGMLGLKSKPKNQDSQDNMQLQESNNEKEIETNAQKDERFRDEIRQIDLDMIIKPADYIEYKCSKCGKLVKIKSN